MLLKTLKSNRTVNFVLIPLMGILLWLKSLIFPREYPYYTGETDTFLYAPIHNLLSDFQLLQTAVILVLLIVMALVLIQMNNKYNVIRVRTMLMAPLYVLIVSGFFDLQVMHPVHFAAFFLVFAFYRLFMAFDEVSPYSPAFDAGFLLGIATLFYTNTFVLYPAFFAGVGILSRETKWREFVVLSIGFFLPFVFAGSYSFVSGQFTDFLNTIDLNLTTSVSRLNLNNFGLIYPGFLLILIFLGTIKILYQYDTKKVNTRKFYIVFFLVFLSVILSFVLVPSASAEVFVLLAVPVTFLLSNFFIFLKSRFWGEFWFSLLFILAVTLQFLT